MNNENIQEIVALIQRKDVDAALNLLKEGKKEPDYKLLARKRIADSFYRAKDKGESGEKTVLNALNRRIQKLNNPKKLQGIIDAIDDMLQEASDLHTKWENPDFEKDLIKVQQLAKKKMRRPALPRRNRPSSNEFGMLPVPMKRALNLCSKKIKQDLAGDNPDSILIPGPKGKQITLLDACMGYLAARVLEK